MQSNERKQITDILNAFRLINKDITKSFEDMSNQLQASKSFESIKPKKNDNVSALFSGRNDWYYLNCYGIFNKKVIGFTFVNSVNYNEEEDIEYSNFIDQLDNNCINKNTPMLCIYGAYDPIDPETISLFDTNGWQYVDDLLQFTESWENDKKEKIAYDHWINMEINYIKDNQKLDGYEGWYKTAKVKIKNITDISSKEEAFKIINELYSVASD